VILVGGFNSAIDKLAEAEVIEAGAVLRLRNVRVLAGGKGLHVALACAVLQQEASLVGLIDDHNQRLFEQTLVPHGVRFVGVRTDQPLRTCLAIRDRTGRTTELLEPSASVPAEVAGALMDALRSTARSAQYIVLSGSLPTGLADETYARLIIETGPGRTLLDASGAALASGVAAAPLLVKPNREEAAHLVGYSIDSVDAAVRAASMIAVRGPRIVVVSLGSGGAVVWGDRSSLHVTAPIVEARNTVGAGDCLLAGFVVGLAREWTLEACARYAVACGTAKVRHPETGMLRREDVDALLPHVAAHSIAATRP
jgi:1-phosphofructokinase family hexose kinase